MSATELIKQVAALPPREKMLFEQLFRAMECGTRPPGRPSQRQWPDFGERLRGIYGDKIASDSQSLVNEGRGDR